MCGICFVWDREGRTVDRDVMRRMTDEMTRRGPDDSGVAFDDDHGVGLGFRRLAIIDLTPAGHQPMSVSNGAFTIVFNGEIYNYREIRKELADRGHRFHSNSDTEVILNAYAEWGEAAVERFIGMFALAIWDRDRRKLFAARDRLGIKPLYYAFNGTRIALASELKPLMLLPWFDRTIDAAGLKQYLAQGHLSAPRSIFRGARSLPPGHVLTLTTDSPGPSIRCYWSPVEFYRRADGKPAGEEELAGELDDLLRSAVKYRLISDVPLGAFLSGGIDSSLVVALMRQVTTAEVKTFTIGFAEKAHDEAPFAERIARHLGATHRTLRMTAPEAKRIIEDLPRFYDEPFADSSQIPTYLLSKLTREHVTVALSGDGGDELFCGYSRYADLASWKRAWRLPSVARKFAAATLSAAATSERMALAARGLAMETPEEFYRFYVSVWRQHEIARLIPALAPIASDPEMNGLPPETPLLDRLMVGDLRGYLPNDILTKVDRASMAVSLEARVPLLDHRVVELALRIPLSLKWRGGVSKYLLRRVLSRYVPQEMIDRPKQGFTIPLDEWLRGDLKWLVDEYLCEGYVRRQGLFEVREVATAVRRFMKGECSHARVWSLLVFQMWFAAYGRSTAVTG